MQIEDIGILNYRQFRSVEIMDLGQLSGIIIANCSDKSRLLFDVLTFSTHAPSIILAQAAGQRGSLGELVSLSDNEPVGFTMKWHDRCHVDREPGGLGED